MNHQHDVAHSDDHHGDGILVLLAKLVAGLFGSPLLLALVLVWVTAWVSVDLASSMSFDANFALLLALTSIPQLPLGIAILVVSNVTQRTQDSISAKQGLTLQHQVDELASLRVINQQQLEILQALKEPR